MELKEIQCDKMLLYTRPDRPDKQTKEQVIEQLITAIFTNEQMNLKMFCSSLTIHRGSVYSLY